MVHVFPYPLTRTATGSWTDFEALRWVTLPGYLAERTTLLARQQQVQEALNEALYQAIQQTGTTGPTAPLLQLKRAVFNGRPLPDLPPTLAPVLRAMLDEYAQLVSRLATWEIAVEEAYQRELLRGREHVQHLGRQEALVSGLQLASPALLAQLPRYQRTSPAAFGKRELQLEGGLLRYLTRLHFKTSPFSTFTAVSVSSLGAVPAGVAWPAQTGRARSVVRLNNYLLAHLQTLLLLVPDLADTLPVQLNPSRWVQDGVYHFLLNHRNLEAFQQLPAQPLLAVVEQELAAGKGLSLRQLAERLAADYVEAAPLTILTWLRELVHCGFLSVSLGVTGTDPAWDMALEQRLAPLADRFPAAEVVRKLLQELRSLTTTYDSSPAPARTAVRQQLEAAFRTAEAVLLAGTGQEVVTAEAAHYRAAQVRHYLQDGPFTVRPYLQADFGLLYEDVTQEAGGQLDALAVQQLLIPLQQALTWLASATSHEVLAPLTAFYERHYRGQPAVPLVEFYQRYVRQGQAIHAEDTALPEPAWPVEQERLAHYLLATLPAYPTVVVVDLAQVVPSLPAAASPSGALAAFIQFFSADEPPRLRGVVNKLAPGLGKCAGRFLHLFADDVTAAHQAWNRRVLTGQGLAAEVTDASYSNANLHPPLLPYHLTLSGGQPPATSATQQLAIADLTVQPDPVTKQLRLWHAPSGQPVLPCDVALQALDSRAELYQFLLQFGPAASATLGPLLAAVGDFCRRHFPAQTEPLPGVFRYPRVQLGAALVVQRRRWYVAAEALPQRTPAERDSQYLVRLAVWQQRLDLPTEVFFSLRAPAAEAVAGTASPDDYKPQYLHFGSPLLVRLF